MTGDERATMSERPAFTMRARRQIVQNRVGHRPVNNWGGGDLPAPWAEGDIVNVHPGSAAMERMGGMGPGVHVVSYATSVDDGDAWYFRVDDGTRSSDRLHVASAARSTWDEDCDFMSGVELIETADPDGLIRRRDLIDAGWCLVTTDEVCRSCRGTGHVQRYEATTGPSDE